MSTKIYANARFAHRADTLENWQRINPVLLKGEPSIVINGKDGESVKIGDGVTEWNSLPFITGPKGSRGDKGEKGDKGDKGDPGEILNLVQGAGNSGSYAASQSCVTQLTKPLRDGIGDAIYSKSVNLYNPNTPTVSGQYLKNGVSYIASTTFNCTDFIEIEGSTQYALGYVPKISTGHIAPWTYLSENTTTSDEGVFFYNANKEYIGVQLSNIFTTPPNAKYIRFNFATGPAGYGTFTNASKKALMLVKGNSLPTKFSAYKQKKLEEKLVELISPLANKTIVNFGDSIFGNTEDISTKLAELTGATVYNCGFAGCRMAAHSYENYNAFSMHSLALAIANNDYSVQENALTLTVQGVTVPSDFSNKLQTLKSIDFSAVDIITIAYGTNDFMSDIYLSETQDQKFSTNRFMGALRYSIETVLTKYPHIRIFLCTPTYRFWFSKTTNEFTDDSNTRINAKGSLLSDYADALKTVAKEYNLPVIDNYDIGINKFTRFAYFPTATDAEGNLYNTDSTHPNRDGKYVIAQNMANKLY